MGADRIGFRSKQRQIINTSLYMIFCDGDLISFLHLSLLLSFLSLYHVCVCKGVMFHAVPIFSRFPIFLLFFVIEEFALSAILFLKYLFLPYSAVHTSLNESQNPEEKCFFINEGRCLKDDDCFQYYIKHILNTYHSPLT